jgi:hypothetical protein
MVSLAGTPPKGLIVTETSAAISLTPTGWANAQVVVQSFVSFALSIELTQ